MNRTDQSRKFKNWNALQLALKRAGVTSHGSTATLLLETFLEDNGRLQASKVVSRRICEEGSFSNWRNEMLKNGWLIWSQNQSDKGQYFAGKKLVSYINKEKILSKEIITRDEAASKSEVENLKERMNRIEEVVQELRKSMEPPETDEKKKARERAAERLTLLAKTH
jgi:hypothetical protein